MTAQAMPSTAPGPGQPRELSSRLELYWIPLGAGDGTGPRVVRASGLIYERLKALVQRRAPQALFHAALVAQRPDGWWAVEMTPVPRDGAPEDRGVVGGGAVGSRLLGRARVFRYEIRRWAGGVIPDIRDAIDSPVVISSDVGEVTRVLALLAEVPSYVWGRDEARTGDMWNSNSVVSWTLASAGCAERAGAPPRQGRAPGWAAGLTVAGRLRSSDGLAARRPGRLPALSPTPAGPAGRRWRRGRGPGRGAPRPPERGDGPPSPRRRSTCPRTTGT